LVPPIFVEEESGPEVIQHTTAHTRIKTSDAGTESHALNDHLPAVGSNSQDCTRNPTPERCQAAPASEKTSPSLGSATQKGETYSLDKSIPVADAEQVSKTQAHRPAQEKVSSYKN